MILMLRSLILVAAVTASLFYLGQDVSARGRRGGCHGGGCGSSCGSGGCGGGGCGASSCGGGGCGGYAMAGYAAPMMASGGMMASNGTMMASATPSGNTAQLVINLPADAKLSLDGQTMSGTSPVRVFQTPDLAPGSDYSYSLRAEITRNGQTQVVVRRATVRAGEETRVDMTIPVSTTNPGQ
jgi:uncharacterized protein (TIGR03000 family)